MEAQRSTWTRGLLVAARFAIIAGVFIGLTGIGRVVGDSMDTGSWQPAWIVAWAVLGALPYIGGTVTGRLLRGPGDEGLFAVALVTTLLGALAAVVWILDGLARR